MSTHLEGEWRGPTSLTLRVTDEKPITQGSMRRARRGGGLAHANDRLGRWRFIVANRAKHAMNSRGLPLIEKPETVFVSCSFWLPRPGSHVLKSGELSAIGRREPLPARKHDLDKLARGVCDALTGIVYEDDAQVCKLEAVKWYATDTNPEGVEIVVMRR